VLTECAPDVEEKFNRWYDGTHVPLLMKSGHITAATRYKIAPMSDSFAPVPVKKDEPVKYLAVYEYQDEQAFHDWNASQETAAARDERKESWGEKGFEVLFRGMCQPLKSWKK
jgi:hypothetical protein